MNPLVYVTLALLVVLVIWAALQFDRLLDMVVLRTAGMINRRAGIVATWLFVAAVSFAILWSSLQ